MASKKKVCYVICPIGEKGSPVRKHSDQVLKHLINPATKKYKYEILRSDMEAEPGIITSRVIQQMADAELVIADLSDYNPNVFYELAIRHVAAKPLVQMIKHDQEIPFDVGQMRTVKFNLGDPDDLEDARAELASHIDALQDVEEIETPVRVSLGLKKALESTDPETVANAEIIAAIETLRGEVRSLRSSGTGIGTGITVGNITPGFTAGAAIPASGISIGRHRPGSIATTFTSSPDKRMVLNEDGTVSWEPVEEDAEQPKPRRKPPRKKSD